MVTELRRQFFRSAFGAQVKTRGSGHGIYAVLSEALCEFFNGSRLDRTRVKALQKAAVVHCIDCFPDAFRNPAVPDFQGAQNRGSKRPQLSFGDPLSANLGGGAFGPET